MRPRILAPLLAFLAGACVDHPLQPSARPGGEALARAADECPLQARIQQINPLDEECHRVPIPVPLLGLIALNNSAQVLGFTLSEAGFTYAVWSRAGLRELGPPAGSGAVGVSATAMNDHGVVVGYATTSFSPGAPGGFTSRLLVWDAAGVATDLGTVVAQENVQVRPTAINHEGAIAGFLVLRDGLPGEDRYQAFVRAPDGAVTLIETPGRHSAAVDMNDGRMVTGWYTDADPNLGPWRGFVWSQAGGFVDLGTLPTPAGSAPSVRPRAINDAGTVVGNVYAFSAATPGETELGSSFLYTPGTGIRDLTALSGTTRAQDVNDNGEILAWAVVGGREQPVTWMEGWDFPQPVRGGIVPQPADPPGVAIALNNWSEVLDVYFAEGLPNNAVWTYGPEWWE